MKYYNILILFTIFILFFSCGGAGNKSTQKGVLSVSIEPQRYFLEQLVGDKYEVNCVIPQGSNPESFDPTPRQMVTLGKSKIYFKVGHLGFENVWMENIQANNPQLLIVDCSQGIAPIEEEHHHHHDGECAHGHEGADPHTWSSPKSAQVMVKNMYEALKKSDRDNVDYYEERFTTLDKEIMRTDSIIRHYLAQTKNHSFIIYHPALSYFARDYGLHQYTIEYEGKNPTPLQLKNLIDLAKEREIKVVFVQQEFDQKNTEIVAQEAGAKIVPINLLSYDWSEEIIKIAKSLSENE